MRGPKPIPTHLKVLRGNPGKQVIGRAEPEPVVPIQIPPAPPFLVGYAREEWDRIAVELHRLNLLTIVDINVLAAYCQAFKSGERRPKFSTTMADRDPVTAGLMIKASKTGTALQNPVYLTARQAANDMVRSASETRLSPLLAPASPPASAKARAAPASSTASLAVKRTPEGKRRAKLVIDFIEQLTVPSGKGQGKPFKLRKWQRDFISDIYVPHAGGRRVVRRAILSMARKNGKTALIAAIALAHLVGPEALVHGEIYSAANDRDQAAIVFKFARQMVELEPDLLKQIEIIQSTKTMIARRTGSVYRAISAEAGTKHGYLPSLVIYDELAQAKSRDLYDVLDTSFGARDEPLFIIMSTQSNDPEHIMSKLIDDGLAGIDPTICCHLFAADEDSDLDDEAQWKKANPALGDFRDYEDLASAIRKAKRLPADEPKVRNLFLNMRVSPSATLISRAEWMGCAGNVDIAAGSEVYLGLDLASVIDLAALAMVSADDPALVRAFFWKPEALLVDQSAKDFGAGNLRYLEWADAGQLLTSPGRSIDPTVIATFIAELSRRYRICGLAYDRWRMDDLLREFDRIGLHAYRDDKADKRGEGLRIVPWGQGFKDMAPAIDALELAIFDRKLVHPSNPVLNFCMANAVATMDPAGNRKLDKDKATFRIDGAVALAMAMGLRSRDRSVPEVDIRSLIG